MTLKPAVKFVLDLIPVAGFFAAFRLYGLFTATTVLLILTLTTLAIIYIAERKIALAPLITAIIVTVFGGLTLYLHDENFIKMKPTLLYLLFSLILLGGCAAKKGLLKHVFGMAFHLSARGWFLLSRRWGFFFLLMALLNEFVRREFSTETWVNFKVFGALGLTVIFTFLQMSFIHKHEEKNDL